MGAPTGERLLPWDPIPNATKVYLEVEVCRLEEQSDVAGMPLAIILVAPRRSEETDGAWRLRFPGVRAYRRLPVGAHAGVHLITLREGYRKRSQATPTTYEVVRSRWIQEIASAVGTDPGALASTLRHFVIAASYVAYEIAAEWCEVEELGKAEQACADRSQD